MRLNTPAKSAPDAAFAAAIGAWLAADWAPAAPPIANAMPTAIESGKTKPTPRRRLEQTAMIVMARSVARDERSGRDATAWRQRSRVRRLAPSSRMRAMGSAAAAAGLRWLDDLGRDTRYAIRTWQRQPAFAIVCLLTLAIGIGGVTSVFSVVAAVLVRPLPYAHADRLIAVWDSHVNDRNLAKIFASYSDFQTWQRESRTVEQFAAVTWAVGDRTLTGYGDARVVLAIPASVEFFTLLG